MQGSQRHLAPAARSPPSQRLSGGSSRRLLSSRSTSGAVKVKPDTNAFIDKVLAGDVKGVKEFFSLCDDEEEIRTLANSKGKRGQSALVIAIRHEFPNLIRLLLKVGADPTFKCDFPEEGTTPLRVAFETDRPNVQKMVCEAFVQAQLADGILTRMQE